jgi:multiple sugar transport system permease protein
VSASPARARLPGVIREALPRGSRARGGGRRRWFETVIALFIIAIFLFPLYWMVNISFQPGRDLVRIPPEWFPVDATLGAYRNAIAIEGRHLLVSLVISLGTAALSLAIATPAAFAMAQLKTRLSRPVLFALLIGQMVPSIVMANALFKVITGLHLINSLLALILADSTLAVPFAVLILRAFMVSVPRELLEAAYVDGASRLRSLWSVVLPISRNAMITAGLFAFLFAWGDFLFGLTLTTTDSNIPVTVGMYRFIGVYTTNWNSVMATGVIASIPAAVLLVVAQRYVAAGVTGGAVKG